ncbi:MAG: hypothetical protein JWM76_2182 [Pseudonocardiales bacterium]|nr:hypothetical protein [Pseudonocardiales bacterium]
MCLVPIFGVASADEGHHLPTGLMTLLFTDIEGSTRLLAVLGDGYVDALNAHRAVVRRAIADGDGHEVDTQGDAFFAVFSDAGGALSAAVAVQRELHAMGSLVRVRIGLHTGEPSRNQNGYVGLDLHRGARICAVGHGGQVLISETTLARLIHLPDRVTVRTLGTHRLKDLVQPVRLSEAVIEGLPDSFPPLRSIDSHPSNLPPDLGDLFGRAEDLDVATGRVRGGARLLTLTGPGGTGKTTLATHLAARLRTTFADGVHVVWLAQMGAASHVAEELARTLGLRERAGTTAEEAVRDYLTNREMLLFLDNFEHVLDAAPLVQGLLEAATGVQILVTSRTALRVRGEVEMRIEPLETSASAGVPAESSPAVELFVARARQAQPDFDPDDASRTVIAEICRRLDGLPLAIELAAARVRLLAPPAMLARLDRPLDVAGGGSRQVAGRQQTLRSTIAWSYGLLDAGLQRAFSRLGVFASPFNLDAAEEVCDVSLDDLAQLLDHNLLRVMDADADRLGMLTTIGAFAAELLEVSEESASVRTRHAEWAARLAAHGGPSLLNADHEPYLGRFDAEEDELRRAMDWLMRSGEFDAALRFGADLAVFWETRGRFTEGRARLEALLAVPVPPASVASGTRDRARVLFSIGRLAMLQNDLARARTVLSEAIPIFGRLGSSRDVIVCQSHIAMADGDSQETNSAILELARQSGDQWAIGVALNNLADGIKTTDPVLARTLLSECLEIRRALGEKRTLSITLGNVGDVELIFGNTGAAKVAYEDSLTAALDVGYDLMIAEARRGLARLALDAGRIEDACSLALDTLERAERLGDAELVKQARALLDEADRAESH